MTVAIGVFAFLLLIAAIQIVRKRRTFVGRNIAQEIAELESRDD